MFAAVFFLAFFAVQVTVPLLRLPTPGASFGWQMYSRVPDNASFTVLFENGRARRVSQAERVAVYRGEVSYEEHLPAWLCSHIPDARAVVVRKKSYEGIGRRLISAPRRHDCPL